MNRSIGIIVLLLVAWALFTQQAPVSADKKPVLAFTPLEPGGVDKYDAGVVSQQLRKEIDAAGVYKTVEFSEIELRLAEQNLPPRCADVQTAVMIGQILGADFVGIGSIDRIGKSYAISMQIVEVRSGRIINNTSEFYKGNFRKFQTIIVPYFARKMSGLPVDEPKKK